MMMMNLMIGTVCVFETDHKLRSLTDPGTRGYSVQAAHVGVLVDVASFGY